MTPTHSTEKPTPRTDEYERNGPNDESPSAHAAWAEVLTFARQLERELNAAATPTPDAVKLAGELLERIWAAIPSDPVPCTKHEIGSILLPVLTAQQADHAATVARLERERDEARHNCDMANKAADVRFENWAKERRTAEALEADLSAARAEVEAHREEKHVINAALNKTDSRGVSEVEQIEWLQAQLTALRERAEGLAKWQTGTPDVEDGCCERFWCCIEGENGKQFHRHLSYANRHVMPLSDGVDDAPAGVEPVPNSDDEYYWTGWHEQSCDHCDTQWMYSGKVIAWMRLPKHDAAEGKGEQP